MLVNSKQPELSYIDSENVKLHKCFGIHFVSTLETEIQSVICFDQLCHR